MADAGHTPSYACKCLNVRIQRLTPSSPPSTPQAETSNDEFINVFVGEQGIHVAHTPLTLRSKGPRVERSAATSQETSRIVSLTCIVCHTLVYRVTQVISGDVENTEGPVLPTDDWAESEILRSSSGWIQVAKHCLTGEAIQDAKTTSCYSKTFGIILPQRQSLETVGEQDQAAPPTPNGVIPSSPRDILPQLPVLFPPPPFTPAHPVFVHLAHLANEESERLRTQAENELRKIVEEKIAEIKVSEGGLKEEVDRLWTSFKETVDDLDEANTRARPSRSRRARSSSRHRDNGVNGTSASVRVRDFMPAPAPALRASATPAPTISALSASLATSSLHNVMASAERPNASAFRSRGSTSSKSPIRSVEQSEGTRADSPSTASSKTLGVPINGEAEIRDAYRRNMDQSLDFATSFKYMLDMGEHIPSREPEQPDVQSEADSPEVPSPSASAVPRGRSPRAGKSAIKKPKVEPGVDGSATKAKTPPSEGNNDQVPPKDNTTPKGKRKVTFDVKPDVAIIASESPAATNSIKSTRAEEAVFEMENENDEDAVDGAIPVSAPPSEPTTPVPEQGQAPRRSRRTASWSGLPSSFSTLRPASLPLPSAVRLVAFQQQDERSRPQTIRESVIPAIDGDVKRREIDEPREFHEEERVTDAREAEILKLVAASTPSHRSAWKKDTSAWRTFVARQKAHKVDRSSIAEEDESSATDGPAYYDESGDDSGPDDDQKDFWSNGDSLAKSLPIPIGPLGTQKKPTVPAMNKVTAAAMRRASYAERDRARFLDPGALDFTAEDDDLDEEDDIDNNETEVGGKSLQRAQKILQRRNEIPEAGMWRSLA